MSSKKKKKIFFASPDLFGAIFSPHTTFDFSFSYYNTSSRLFPLIFSPKQLFSVFFPFHIFPTGSCFFLSFHRVHILPTRSCCKVRFLRSYFPTSLRRGFPAAAHDMRVSSALIDGDFFRHHPAKWRVRCAVMISAEQ